MRPPGSVVALDIGGSSVKSARVTGGQPDGRVTVTPIDHAAPADELIERLAAAIRAAAGATTGRRPVRVAAAVPDPFDHAAGVSRMTHKFGALEGQPLAPPIAAALGRAVEIRWCNDAAAAVTGEAVAGAGAAYRRVLGVTLGTGLGAALVVDGTLRRSAGTHTVGDLWQVLLADGRRADTAFAARTLLAAVTADPTSGGVAFGAQLGELLEPVVAAAAAEVVVVGGGGSGSFAAIADALEAAIGVPALAAALGPWAALLGAAHLCYTLPAEPNV